MNILAIGAHFDDIELGCGGALAKHVSEKDNVSMVVVTHSAYMTYKSKPIRSKDAAFKEGKNAALILGIKKITCLGYETKKVQYCAELIEQLNRIIDELHIDTVYTHWTGDVHQDHSAIAKATLNAARHVPRILMYRSNWYASAETYVGNFYIDISKYMDKKIKSIKAHKTEYDKFGQRWIDFVAHQNRNSGIELGVDYAEAFQLARYLNA